MSKFADFLGDLTYAFLLSAIVAFCYLPFARPDYPWWSRPLAMVFGTALIWLGRTTPRNLE